MVSFPNDTRVCFRRSILNEVKIFRKLEMNIMPLEITHIYTFQFPTININRTSYLCKLVRWEKHYSISEILRICDKIHLAKMCNFG